MPDPHSDCRDNHEPDETAGCFVIAGGESATVLQLGEASLNEVAQGVDVAVDGALNLSVAFGWDNGGNALCVEVGEDGVRVVALVGEDDAGGGPWLGHQRREAFDVIDLAARQKRGDRQSQTVCS